MFRPTAWDSESVDLTETTILNNNISNNRNIKAHFKQNRIIPIKQNTEVSSTQRVDLSIDREEIHEIVQKYDRILKTRFTFVFFRTQL
jgi:hypothetical protein